MKPAILSSFFVALGLSGLVHAAGEPPSVQMAVELAGPFTVSGTALPGGEKVPMRVSPVESRNRVVCEPDPHTPPIQHSGTAAAARTAVLASGWLPRTDRCPPERVVYLFDGRLPIPVNRIAGPGVPGEPSSGLEVLVTY